ncbi:MAG: hypothetical protein ACI8RZ_001104 [Myxococcota bacterium]|jgi:hypothetical protein
MRSYDILNRSLINSAPSTTTSLLLSYYDKDSELCGEDLEALASLTSLTSLSLRSKERLDDAGLARLPVLCPDLEHLTLTLGSVTSKGLAHVAKLSKLSKLSLREMERIRKLGALSKLPLTSIKVASCSKFDLATLADAVGLTTLKVVNQPVSTKAFAAFAALPDLKELELYGYKTTIGVGLESHLAKMTKLTSLRIVRPLSEAEVAAVVGLPALEKIYAYVETAADLERLAPLSGGPQVRLRFTNLEEITDELLERIPAILPDLDGLNLDQGQVVNRGQKFGERGLTAVGKLSSLRFLNLYRGGSFKNAVIAPLANLKKLEGLNLHGCYKLTAGAAKTIAGMTSLRRLNVSSMKFSDGALKKLSVLPLEELYVHDAKITDKGMIYLSKCTTLRRLNVDFGNVEINDAGLQALSALTALEELTLKVGIVSPAAFATLAALPKLKRLRLGGNSNITRINDEHFEALSASTSLENFSLGRYMKRSITDAGFMAMARIPSLTLLQFRDRPGLEASEALQSAGVLFKSDAHFSFDAYIGTGLWESER